MQIILSNKFKLVWPLKLILKDFGKERRSTSQKIIIIIIQEESSAQIVLTNGTNWHFGRYLQDRSDAHKNAKKSIKEVSNRKKNLNNEETVCVLVWRLVRV